MFDLKYYQKLKKNNYHQQPHVDLLFVYEDIFLNIDKTDEEKLVVIKERNKALYSYMKNIEMPDYPCLYQEHHKHKNKIEKVLSMNENIYIFIVINNTVELRTKSKASDDIKKIIYNQVVSQMFSKK